jgi:hypothetical protein
MHTTNTTARVGAACGIGFPLALIAGRNSSATFMLSVFGLALFVPFLAYICSLLRTADKDDGWLAAATFGAGLMGMTLKLSSAVPEIAYRAVPAGSQAHKALDGLASAATVASLYPFAIFTTIVAIQSLRTHALPRWLGVFAGLTAVTLLINGSFEHAGTVPALLLFVVWTLTAGIALFIHELRLQPLTTTDPATAN